MFRIGLTGGIGSGKSTIAAIFEVLGIPVYYADDAAKRLMNSDDDVKAAIINIFGKESYNKQGLNREYLSSVVFNNPERLTQLNAIVHPATLKDAAYWMSNQHSPYAVKEAALIFESGADKDLDFVIGVQAPEELRIKRTIERENITEEDVRARMKNQLEEQKKLELCDFIVVNDENEMIIQQVLELHLDLIQKSKVERQK